MSGLRHLPGNKATPPPKCQYPATGPHITIQKTKINDLPENLRSRNGVCHCRFWSAEMTIIFSIFSVYWLLICFCTHSLLTSINWHASHCQCEYLLRIWKILKFRTSITISEYKQLFAHTNNTWIQTRWALMTKLWWQSYVITRVEIG